MVKREEFVFIYSVRRANPNGDPLQFNLPRSLADQRVWATDVRLKRFVRDEGLIQGDPIWINGEAIKADARLKQLKEELGLEDDTAALTACRDVRLFGVVAPKEDVKFDGPIQILDAESFHPVNIRDEQGTAGFASKGTAKQRSFRHDQFIDYGVLAAYGALSEENAKRVGTTAEDVDAFYRYLWNGMKSVHSRSKFGHEPEMILRVQYEDEAMKLWFGDLRDEIEFVSKKADPRSILNRSDYELRLKAVYNFMVERMVNAYRIGPEEVFQKVKVTVQMHPRFPLTDRTELEGWDIYVR